MEIDSEGAKPADGGQGSAEKVQANERLLFCAEVLIGYKCEVQVSFCVLRGLQLHQQLLLVGWVTTSCGAVRAETALPDVFPVKICCLMQLVDGTTYEGIFHTMKVEGKDAHMVLKYAKVIKDPSITAEGLQAIAKKPEVTKVIHSDDIAGLVAKDVRMAAEDLGPEQWDVGGFETDAAISRGRGG